MVKVTIKEVAKLAEVSPSTVSRVVSDCSSISDETKKKVREAMEELGYHPNAIARSLVSKTTNTLGIVMPQSAEKAFLNPFFPQAISGISAACHDERYCILLSTGTCEKEQLVSIEEMVRSGRVDGVIVMYSSVDNLVINALKQMKFPCLVIGKPLEPNDTPFVDNDNIQAAFEVTEKLIEKGHKKIGFISGPLNYIFCLDRLEGYKRALQKYNIEFSSDFVTESEYLREDGFTSMKKLLSLKDRPTAIVVTDDVMAFGAIEAIKDSKFNIPKDMEIISFNNIPLTEFSNPSLTSVDINAVNLGYEAAKLMINRVKGKTNKKKVIVPTKIIYRETFTK